MGARRAATIDRGAWSAPWSRGVALLLVLFAVVDGWLFFVGTGQVFAWAAVAAFVAAGVAVALPRLRTPAGAWMLVAAWLAVVLLAIPAAWEGVANGSRSLRHVAGDAATVLLPLGMLVLGWRHPSLFRSRRTLAVLGAGLALAAVVSMLSPVDAKGRHAHPVTLALVLAWALFARGSARTSWRLAAPTLALLLVAAVVSGYRSSMVLWFLTGGAFFVIGRGPRRVPPLLLAGVAGLLLWTNSGSEAKPLQRLRVERLAQGRTDASVDQRTNEVRDVWRQISTDWGPARWLVGAGHGATLEVHHATPLPTNVDEHGRIHTIHVTPVLVLFRYGLMGCAAMLVLVCVLVRRLFTLHAAHRAGRPPPCVETLFPLALVAYLAESLVRVTFVDPSFSYALAGFVHFQFTRAGIPGQARAPEAESPSAHAR